MALGIFLLLGGYVLVYAAVKGASPLDVLISSFTGQPLKTFTSGAPGASSPAISVPHGGSKILELCWPSNQTDCGGTGHDDHLHLAYGNPATLLVIAQGLVKKGFTVTGHPAFPPVGTGHVDNSYHYKGLAIDVNWHGSGDEAAKLDEAADWIMENWS